jgi:3-methyl-2-oxobutanoate hydroxymethyltransferase
MITEAVEIPTIGIGAGPHCDGQVLVLWDMLGLFKDFKPKFVKKYADIRQVITDAVQEYTKDVREGNFPTPEHSFEMTEEDIYRNPVGYSTLLEGFVPSYSAAIAV